MRKTQILKDDKWIPIPFNKLRKGNRFRMFENDNSPVLDSKGEPEWTALSDAFKDTNGQWTVKINESNQ